ncbi:hypothetical protein XHV734_3521 [Xanthomonas hortorum pv. vitians]|nr:hypothetical protein XHV734_3521 [Xanthomonas hortorum pv. vitians]
MTSVGTGMPDEGARWPRAHDMSAMLQLYGKRAAAHMPLGLHPCHCTRVAWRPACPHWPCADSKRFFVRHLWPACPLALSAGK